MCHMTGLRNDNLSKQVVNQWILTHLRPQPFQRRCTLRHFCRSFFPGVWRWHIRGARGRRLQTATATSSVWPHALQDTARVLGAVQAGVRDRKRVLWVPWKIWEKDPGSQNQSKGIYIIWKLNNKIPIDVWFVRIGQIVWLFDHTTIWKSGIWGCKKKKKNIEKFAFKVVQMKFLAMHIPDQKLSFDIFTVGNLQNILMEHVIYLIS